MGARREEWHLCQVPQMLVTCGHAETVVRLKVVQDSRFRTVPSSG
jgi:hypothetical protein